MTIDLGNAWRIKRVDVYNRVDCCMNRAIPLRLEVSRDGKSYRTIAEQTVVFYVWKVRFDATEVRYVRLTRLGQSLFHLAEIEVY